MYKAQHQPSGGEIVILDPRWKSQIETLREMDRQDALVCPGCQQPVRVRAGKYKRPHFAHKHLQNCPFERASPRLLQSRAVLYDWLTIKFDLAAVSVEKVLDPLAGIRPFDCWVELDQEIFAYWIFDRRMPPDERKGLQNLCTQHALDAQWVFLIDLLRPDEFSPRSRLHLTTTERAFIRRSALDRAWQTHFEQLGGGLHYLDPDQLTLTTYRNLTRVHPPQVYTAKRLHRPFSDVLVSKVTGEFVHPGELEKLERTQQRLDAQQRQTEERKRRAESFLSSASFSKKQIPTIRPTDVNPFERQATCRICGTLTSDWVTYFGQTRECICRDCQERPE